MQSFVRPEAMDGGRAAQAASSLSRRLSTKIPMNIFANYTSSTFILGGGRGGGGAGAGLHQTKRLRRRLEKSSSGIRYGRQR